MAGKMRDANEPFWNSEQQLGTVSVSEKEKRVVKIVSKLNESNEDFEEKWWVSLETWKYFKKKGEVEETWRVVKNATIPLAVWDEINEMVQEACSEEEE